MPLRPQRAGGLTASTVRVVLNSSGTQIFLINAYLAAAHALLGLLVMTIGLEDILKGGPTRPSLMPVVGTYMAASVSFYLTLRTTRPRVLAWILGLSDVVLLMALNNLTSLSTAAGHEVTFACVAAAVFVLYAVYAMPRMSLVLSLMTITGFVVTTPATSYVLEGNFHLVRPTDLLAIVLVLGAAVVAFRISTIRRVTTTASAIMRMERIDFAVSEHLNTMDLPGPG